MQGKRNYKDSLFRNIFKDKKRLCSLYNTPQYAIKNVMVYWQAVQKTHRCRYGLSFQGGKNTCTEILCVV